MSANEPPKTEITLSLEAVQGEVSKFDQIGAGLAELERLHPKDVVFDVTTPQGMDEAIVARRAWREPRIAVEKARKAAKAPVLELGKRIDRFAGDLEVKLRDGEDHYDRQIQAEEDRREAIRAEKLRAEAEKIAAVRRQIVEAFSPPRSANGVPFTVAQLDAFAARMEAEPLGADRFGDLQIEAAEAKCAGLEWIACARVERAGVEAEEARIAADRAAFVEEQRKATAARAEERRVEDEARAKREAEEKARREAERADIDAREAAVIAARKALDDRLEKQAAEDAERARIADAERDARAAAERDRLLAEQAARERVAAAAPRMLRILQEWQIADESPHGQEVSDALRRSRDDVLAELAT